MKIRVDNLAADTTEDDLRMLFELFGAVAAVTIDQRRRWSQIDMPSKSATRESIDGLKPKKIPNILQPVLKRDSGGPFCWYPIKNLLTKKYISLHYTWL